MGDPTKSGSDPTKTTEKAPIAHIARRNDRKKKRTVKSGPTKSAFRTPLKAHWNLDPAKCAYFYFLPDAVLVGSFGFGGVNDPTKSG